MRAIGAGNGATGASNIDVYPFIVCGQDSVYDVALRGEKAIDIIHNPIGQNSKSDPLNQRGYVGAKFWAASKIVNGGWMGVIEAGSKALT